MSDPRPIRLLYAHDGLQLAVPEDATILTGTHPPGLPNPAQALRQALAHPLGSRPLADLIKERRPQSVAITISDITRPVPNPLILPALLEVLNSQGLADSQITIVVGTGMHRPSTAAEHRELVGPDILARCRIVDHRSDDPTTMVPIPNQSGGGGGGGGGATSINSAFARADFRIVTGLIEPHFMAGFSGGRKGVCPALVDLATVQRFHGHAILSDPRSASGQIEGNPCHAESLRIARLVGVDFLVNVAINNHRQITGIYAGEMESAHAAGCAQVAQWTTATIDQPFDLVVTTGGGYPLDLTYYQTVKGMVAALPACHDCSTILIVADCREGLGSKSYSDTMLAWSGRWRDFLTHISTDGGGGTPVTKDQWQAQMQCRVLERIGPENLWLATDGLPPEIQSKLWLTPVPGTGSVATRTQQALDRYLQSHPQARIAIIPEGPYTLLRRAGSPSGTMNDER